MNKETITLQLVSMVLAHNYDLHEGASTVDLVIESVKKLQDQLFTTE